MYYNKSRSPVTRALRYLSSSTSSPSCFVTVKVKGAEGQERPRAVVLVLGFGGAQPRHVEKYARLYNRKGCSTVSGTASNRSLFVDPTGIDAFAHADVVTTSLTKAFSGVGDVLAGAVIVSGRSAWSDPLRRLLSAQEAAAPLFGLDAVVLEKNSVDFVERVRRMTPASTPLRKRPAPLCAGPVPPPPAVTACSCP